VVVAGGGEVIGARLAFQFDNLHALFGQRGEILVPLGAERVHAVDLVLDGDALQDLLRLGRQLSQVSRLMITPRSVEKKQGSIR
jgi:Tfp pilus assembly ATPase PilU